MVNSGVLGNFPSRESCCSDCECQGRLGEDGASCETAWAVQKRRAKSNTPYLCVITWDPGWPRSAGPRTLVDVMARTMKLTANAGPMPVPFPIVSQTEQVQRHATKTVLSEHKCHGMPFALSTKRSGFSAPAVYRLFSSSSRLGTKNAKLSWS